MQVWVLRGPFQKYVCFLTEKFLCWDMGKDDPGSWQMAVCLSIGLASVPFLAIAVFQIWSLLTFTKPAWHSTARTVSQRSRRQTIPSLPPAGHSRESYCFPGSAIFMSEHRSRHLSSSQDLFGRPENLKYEGWYPAECCLCSAPFPALLRLSLWGRWWSFFIFYFLNPGCSFPSLFPSQSSSPQLCSHPTTYSISF